MVIEEKNKERLKNDLYKNENGTSIPKTKTMSIINKIANAEYIRGPEKEVLQSSKYEAKTIIIARYGMLECGNNFKGTLSPHCRTCNTKDDENHRLNECPLWKDSNLGGAGKSIDFQKIYDADIDVLRPLVDKIGQIWNTKNAHGNIRTE